MSIFQKGISKFSDNELRDLRHCMSFFNDCRNNRQNLRLKPTEVAMASNTLERFLWALEKEFPRRSMEKPYEEEF